MRDWVAKHGRRASALWAVAFICRCVYVFQSDVSPFFDFPLLDAKTYVDSAVRLTAGNWVGDERPFWQPPFYPYFLGLIYTFLGPGYYATRLIQAAVGAANCILIYILGQRVFSSPTVGLLAGGLAAVYGPLVFFDGELLPPSLAVFLDLTFLIVLLQTGRTGQYWLAMGAGVLAGISALCVANILLFLPVAGFWLYRRCGLSATGIFFLGAVIAVAPVTLRNLIRGNDLVLISSNAGVNFFIGNNPDYQRTIRIQPGAAWRDLVSIPRREAGLKRASQQSGFFFRKALDFFLTEPWEYLRLQAYKTYLLFHGYEIGRNQDLYYARQYSGLLTILLWAKGIAFPFGVIAPLSLLGIGLGWQRGEWSDADCRLVVLFMSVYAMSVILFFVSARHRLPMIPLLLLFAAYAVVQMASQWRARRKQRMSVSLGCLCLLVLVCNNDLSALQTVNAADTQHRLGFVFQEKGLHFNAIDAYQKALDIDPVIPEARFNLASLLAQRGQWDEAETQFRAFVERYPHSGEGRYGLANVYLVTRRYHEAVPLYEQLLDISSSVPSEELGTRLAYGYMRLDRADEAATLYRRLLVQQPQSLRLRFLLGQLLEVRGQHLAATIEYQEIIERDPAHFEARSRLAELLLSNGKTEMAKQHLYVLIQQQPDTVEVRWSLAKQLVIEHRGEEALEQVEDILQIDPHHVEANWVAGHLHVIRGDTLTGADHLGEFRKLYVAEKQEKIGEHLMEQWTKQYERAFTGIDGAALQ